MCEGKCQKLCSKHKKNGNDLAQDSRQHICPFIAISELVEKAPKVDAPMHIIQLDTPANNNDTLSA